MDVNLALLPQVGEMVPAGKNSIWGPCTVTRVTNNFVHTDKCTKKGGKGAKNSVSLKPGMLVELRNVPPLDDHVTILLVVSVGIIYAGKSKTVYRGCIIRRRSADAPNKTWGQLETINAADFPDADHCNVRATTTPHN